MKRTSLTLSILLLFAGGVWGAIENDEAIYLACEHGVKKSQDLGKFKPGQHTLDKLLKNEIKLSSIKKLRKLRCRSNPCKQYRDDLYIYGMKGLRYHLFKINDEVSLGKAKVCRTILHSIQKDDDKYFSYSEKKILNGIQNNEKLLKEILEKLNNLTNK